MQFFFFLSLLLLMTACNKNLASKTPNTCCSIVLISDTNLITKSQIPSLSFPYERIEVVPQNSDLITRINDCDNGVVHFHNLLIGSLSTELQSNLNYQLQFESQLLYELDGNSHVLDSLMYYAMGKGGDLQHLENTHFNDFIRRDLQLRYCKTGKKKN